MAPTLRRTPWPRQWPQSRHKPKKTAARRRKRQLEPKTARWRRRWTARQPLQVGSLITSLHHVPRIVPKSALSWLMSGKSALVAGNFCPTVMYRRTLFFTPKNQKRGGDVTAASEFSRRWSPQGLFLCLLPPTQGKI